LVTVDHDPLAYLSGKVITISTSCSGIDTPIFALKVLASQLGFKIDNVFAVENDGPCREELLVSGLKPRYLFDNLLSWIRPRIMKEAREIHASDYRRLRDHILSSKLEDLVWCVRHGKMDAWRPLRAMMHIAGVPYGGPSFGKKRCSTGTNILLYSWMAVRRVLQEPLVIFGCGKDFCQEDVDAGLGDIYTIEAMMLDSCWTGWASDRLRLFMILTLKSSSQVGLGAAPSPFGSVHTIVSRFIYRNCAFTQSEYLIANDAELNKDYLDSMNREHVIMRHDLDLLGAKDPKNVPVGIRFSGDTPGTYEYALTCRERSWLEETLKKYGRG